ncbi:hypothetical protein [Nostoc sp.]
MGATCAHWWWEVFDLCRDGCDRLDVRLTRSIVRCYMQGNPITSTTLVERAE